MDYQVQRVQENGDTSWNGKLDKAMVWVFQVGFEISVIWMFTVS